MSNYDGSPLRERGGLLVWQTPQFGEEDGVLQFFTTRLGGVSRPPYQSLNLSFTTQDDPYAIQENRSLVETTFQTRLSKWANQVHGDNVLAIKERLSLDSINELPQDRTADAIVTALPGISLTIYFADCLPIFIFDPVSRVIALVHAGWRGTLKGVARNAVKNLASEFGVNSENILASLGPSIGPCCMEIKSDVLEQFKSSFHYWPQLIKRIKQHCYLDLWLANFLQLREAGLLPDNIFISQLCTSCNNDLFYSNRRDYGITGRMAGVILLKEVSSN